MVLLIQSIHYKCQLCFLVIDSCKTCCLLFIMAHSRRRGCRLKCRSMRLPQYWAFAAYIKVLIGFGIRQQSFTVTLANFQCSNSRTAVSLWSIVFSHLDPVLHLSWFLYVLEIIACVPIMTLMQSLQCTEHRVYGRVQAKKTSNEIASYWNVQPGTALFEDQSLV